MARRIEIKPYDGPAGGWGSLRSLLRHAWKNGHVTGKAPLLARQNKTGGFACVSCAWAKPAKAHPAEFCENGAKATFWEASPGRLGPEFFAAHSITELRSWPDHDLEAGGRLTHPLRFDHAADRYVAASWEEAFADIGRELAAIRDENPKAAIFYASGRASLEASYMYQLLARVYGNNNLPDSSNMCHESTSVALPESIGSAVGTVLLEDFDHAEAIFFFGQNVGSNSPRMLHNLQTASERGARIVSFNPLRERGLERFVNPQSPSQMLTGGETRISCAYHQVRPGGDIAAMAGICKALLETHDLGGESPLDTDFIAEHTHGFDAFAEFLRIARWDRLEHESGLSEEAMREAAQIYARSSATIAVYGMGLTQHKAGVTTIQMLVNLLLLKGNIGRNGAGICPVRGHSNVQGQRTVGISEKPALVPISRLASLYKFNPPSEDGYSTVDACAAIIDGRAEAFIGLGGNFLRAVPDRGPMEEAWPRMRLTVQVATKLNRSHLFNGRTAYLLPCLGRTELDRQATGIQTVTTEDSTSCIHASRGRAQPASPHLLSEPNIVAGIALATLGQNPNLPWEAWCADYALVRDAIERTYPETFRDFNRRMSEPGGFEKPIPARERRWMTETGKANFILPNTLCASFDDGTDNEVLRLLTLRSNDQFNTTIYGYHDRFRGVEGTRMVVFMNAADIRRRGLSEGTTVTLECAAKDGVDRRLSGLRIVTYEIPQGSCAAYYPECNVLVPLWQYAERSKVPAAKSVPVYVRA